MSEEEKNSLKNLFSYRSKKSIEDNASLIERKRPDPINPVPFFRVNDLNNQNEQDKHDDNRTKRAVEFGLKWSF